MNKACSWKYEHYSDCMRRAQEQGYAIRPFRDIESIAGNERFIILRHDIDRTMGRALGIARLEHSLGIRATYFVRLHASTYNIFEYRVYQALKEILALGHEIGVHFEAIDFAHIFPREDPKDVFLREKKILETVLNIPVYSAAAHGEHTSAGTNHNRSFFINTPKEEVGIRYNAYDPEFTREIKYISDSFGMWRENCMCNYIGKEPRLQILVHPCWWYKDNLFEGS